MTVSAKWFGNAPLKAFNKEIDYDTDTIKVALFTDVHAPDQDTDIYYDGSNGMTEVANGSGYTTGGATLANKTIAYNSSTNVVKLDADDVTWSASTITARYALIYDDSAGSNKPLLGYVDFGANQNSSAGNFTIVWDAAGILTLTAA